MNSGTVLGGNAGLITMTKGRRMMLAIGAMPRRKTKLSVPYTVALIAFAELTTARLDASGGTFATASVAILLAAPGRLSMTNGWPSRSDGHWPMRRAMISAAPPAAKPTTMRTGRDG